MGKSYLVIMMGMGLVGAFVGNLQAPSSVHSLESGGDQGFSDKPSRESSNSDGSSGLPGTGDALVLERRGDGHFYADVEVNGVPISMLVDTGASGVALSAEDARRAGIGTTIGMSGVIGEGASGDVHGDIVTIDRIRLGTKERSDVTAAVLKGGSMSLLGQSFLREFSQVEISGDRMHLR